MIFERYYLQISQTVLKLNFFLLASHKDLSKLIPAHLLLLTLLATLVLSLMNTSLSLRLSYS